jgi:hypothetical protein
MALGVDLPPGTGFPRPIRHYVNRRLSAEEFEAWVRAPTSEEERAEILSLVAWFTRCYPTARERLASARRGMQNAERLRAARRRSP